jgi:trehalose-6-phosphatase
VSGELPRVKVEPVIWDFDLITIDNFLLEDTVSVTKTITPCRVVERGKTVEEAGGQSPKATIPKRCIMFLGDDILDPETEIGKTIFEVSKRTSSRHVDFHTSCNIFQSHIQHCIVQCSAH